MKRTSRLLSGIILLVAGILLWVFTPVSFILSILFLVAGMALLAPLVSLRVKLSLGITLLLASVPLWVFGGYHYLYLSILFIFAGLVLLMTLATRRGRLFLGATLLLGGIFMLVFMHFMEIISIPISIAGLVLLATAPKGTTDLKKPGVVTLVGVFALLGSIGLGLLAFLVILGEAIGSFPGGPGMSLYASLLLLSLGVFALSSLFLSIVVLRDVSSKYLWYVLMAYWIVLLAFSLVFVTFASLANYNLTLFMLTPIYPVICITCLSTNEVRQYYHLTAVDNPV